MNRDVATVLLRSLLGRVAADPGTGVLALGSVSALEREALEEALLALGGDAPRVAPLAPPTQPPAPLPENAPSPVVVGPPRVPSVALCLDSLAAHDIGDPSILLCLDFGTAMSKAYATVIEDGDATEQLPLRLGERAKAAGGVIYPVPSSFWIADDGRIYLGPQAIALSTLNDGANGRQRFDSLKRELTQGLTAASLDHVTLDRSINPTSTALSQADALTLFLAYLTDLACSELGERYGKSRFVRRRFALPSWDEERRKWGEQTLRDLLARAQVVADTFHGLWDRGIDVRVAKAVLDEVRGMQRLPLHLVAEGVAEPLAAGASRLRNDEPTRSWAIVVDVGAGTSDFALFVVSEDPDRGIFRAWPVKACSGALQMAGDTLDKALRSAIMEHARVSSEDSDYRHVVTSLNQRVRGWKEDLFRDGFCTYTLTNGARGTIDLQDFLARDAVGQFGARLRETFLETLHRADASFPAALAPQGIRLLLTGGGANLPMVKSLGSLPIRLHGYDVECRGAALVPDAFSGDEEMTLAYPQLAVAIGGAMPDVIDEGRALDKMPDVAERRFTAQRFQVTGT